MRELFPLIERLALAERTVSTALTCHVAAL
jgi:hypothetical protein